MTRTTASSPLPLAPPDLDLTSIDPFFQPRRASFCLLVVLLLNGLFSIGQLFAAGFRVVPVAALLGLLAWALYTLGFVVVFRAMDLLDQHAPAAYVMAFAWGGLGAAHLAAPANSAIQSLAAKLISPDFVVAWGPALAGPITEEFLKLAGVILIILTARNQFRTDVSVLVVGAMTGLGFQVVENLNYTVRSAITFPSDSQVQPVLWDLVTRGVLSGLWTHAAYTAVASYGLALYLLRRERTRTWRIGMAVLCFALAWAMHFVWNSPWMEDWFSDDFLGLTLLLLSKGLPVLFAVMLIWHAATRETGAYLHSLAATLVPERDLLRDDEWLRLGSPLDRWRVRREMGAAYGRRARRLKTRMQREQLQLVLKAGMYGRGARTARHERAIRRIRAKLDAILQTATAA